MENLRAIIPVAGVGSRLRPHTHSAPKVLLHVAGKPILGHILDQLKSLGVSKLTLIIGYRGDMIRQYVDSNYNFDTTYAEQDELKGLGHAIHLTAERARESERLLIVLGDTIFKADLSRVLESESSLIGVREVDDPGRFGIIELDGDRIAGMEEKPDTPKSNLAIVGIYYITKPAAMFDCLDELLKSGETTRGEYQLTDALQMMLDRGVNMKPFKVDAWYDCGKPETLLKTNRELLDYFEADGAHNRYPGCIIKAPVFIAQSAKIENSIVGPYVSVSEDAIVKNAILRDSIISRNALVENILLNRSIVSDNAKVAAHPYVLNVGDSSELSLL